MGEGMSVKEVIVSNWPGVISSLHTYIGNVTFLRTNMEETGLLIH